MRLAGFLTREELNELHREKLKLSKPSLSLQAAHFVQHLISFDLPPAAQHFGKIHSSLDGQLQQKAQLLLEEQLRSLQQRQATDGALLAVDHHSNQVIAWVNAGGFSQKSGSQIDAIRMPRQPGSTLKPFLYAAALEKGWTAATLINDAPLAEPVGLGLHSYRNYSRKYYGPLRLREALGNSLNIPAVRTVSFVGQRNFIAILRQLGFDSISQDPEFYGDGIALGNAEVSLYELVRAYAVLARHGVYRDLQLLRDAPLSLSGSRRVFGAESASLIADVLSDAEARRREFGNSNLLRFPVQTAVKTGTSSDYRDAWAVGFNHRYTVGIWMGNLDGQPMREVSGSIGPALVLRAVFAELERYNRSRHLYLSPKLHSRLICADSGEAAHDDCPTTLEWFKPGSTPNTPLQVKNRVLSPQTGDASKSSIQMLRPSPNLHLAKDPRIPDQYEFFPFEISPAEGVVRTEWSLNGEVAGVTGPAVTQYLWSLERGTHIASARVWLEQDSDPIETEQVNFIVK